MGKPDEENDKRTDDVEPTPTADLPGPRLEPGSRIGQFRIEGKAKRAE
jgi:hypothetical protein